MNYADTITILSKMKRKLETETPKWLETATDEERIQFEIKNRGKIDALAEAIQCVQGYKKLETARNFLDGIFNGD